MTDTTAREPAIEKPRPLRQDVWDQFRTHKGAMLGLIVLGLLVVFITVGPFLWQIDPAKVEPDAAKMILSRNKPPSWEHPLGTDQLARDMLARLMSGGKVSLAVGTVAMLISIFIGTSVGVMAGYFPRLDGPLMRLTDLFLALPLLPLLLVMMMLFGDAVRGALGFRAVEGVLGIAAAHPGPVDVGIAIGSGIPLGASQGHP